MGFDVNSNLPWEDPRKRLRCARCLYDDRTPSIRFNEKGVCNYCEMHDRFDAEFQLGPETTRKLEQMVEEIKRDGKGKPFDCVVGVSGGCDSSYLLYLAKEYGLRPLAVHFDNTWNSAIATENIRRVLQKLNVELSTVVVNNKEYDDIVRSFVLAGVPDVDAPTDIGFAATHYRAAEKYGIKYVLEGHSFRTEGISPLGWLYMDGKYIQSVHRTYGKMPMRTYPNLSLYGMLKWMAVKKIKKVRPLYYIDYHKEKTKEFLKQEFGWQWYGGHHLENRFSAFFHLYILPRRIGVDTRLLGFSGLIRTGQMTREEGMELISKPPVCDSELIDMVRTRLGFSEAEWDRAMTQPLRTYKDFRTYKKTFERLKPFFWVLAKADLIPMSFYIKYTARAAT